MSFATATPGVSILLPARNAANTLPAALDSLQCQSLQSWELLLVDDGSEDDTAAIAAARAARDPRIRPIPQQPAGLVHSLNHGLSLARAPLIARLDADDVCLPERLELQASFLDRHRDVDLVGCRVAFGGNHATAHGYALHVEWANGILESEDLRLNRFIESPLPHPSVMYRTHCVARWGGYRDGPFPEDYELWLRWFDQGARMAKLPETLLVWNDPPGRLSRHDPRYATDAFYRVKAQYLARQLQATLRHRDLWIWGAGRVTRRRAEWLESYGVPIRGWIDIDPRKTRQRPGARPVRLPGELPSPTEAVVVSYVGRRGARPLIRAALQHKGFREGRDAWIAA